MQFFDAITKAATSTAKKWFFDDLPQGDHATHHLNQPAISAMLPYLAYDATTHLYQMEKTVGMIIEMDPVSGLDVSKTEILGQLFGDSLPEGCHVQIMNWSSPKVGYKLQYWERARKGSGEILERMARERREHLANGVWNSLSKSMPFHVRDYRVILAFELDGFADGDAGSRLSNLREIIKGTLNSLNSSVYNVEPQTLMGFLRAILNPNSGQFLDTRPYDNEVSLSEQMVENDTSMRLYEDKILTSSWYDGDPYEESEGPRKSAGTHKFEIRTFSVDKFPEECNQNRVNALLGDMFQTQIQPLGSNLTVLYFQSRGYAESKSTTEFKSIRANQQAMSPISRFVPSFARVARDWNYVNDQVQSGAKLCDMMMFVVQLSPRGAGEEADRYLRTVWMNAGFTLRRNDYLHMAYLTAAMPLSMGTGLLTDFKAMKRTRTLLTSSMSLLAPVQGEPLGFRRPDMLLLGRRGQLFNWSPFSNEEEGAGGGNFNVAVIGGSGAGKSFWMQEMAVSLYSAGATVDVFDDGESFKNTVKLLEGQHINFNLNSGICINPFSMLDHERAAEDNEYMSDCKSGIVDIILQMALGTNVLPGQPSQHQRGMVSLAVNAVWNEQGPTGTITMVAGHLAENEGADGQILVKGLSEYIQGGAYEDLFNNVCNLKADGRFLVYELAPLESKPDLRAVVVLSLLMVTAQRMKFAPRSVKKALIIDEAWKMLADGAAGSFIEGFARRCRKMGGSLITGTQSLDDYEQTAGARACIQNSEWVILMKVKPEALARFENNKILSCSESELQVVRSLRVQQGEFSEMYIRGPGCQVVARFTADKFTSTLYSTKSETFDAIGDLVARGFSVGDAVFNVANKIETKTDAEKSADKKAADFYVKYPALARFGQMYSEMPDEQRGPFIRHIYRLTENAGKGRVEPVIEVDHAAE